MRILKPRTLLPALFLLLVLPLAAHAQVSVGLSINVAPPEIPVYEQPPLPEEGYVWTPGFWQWGPDGYFWVPGTWVQPPTVGVLWTPGYWGWGDGAYVFHEGYWGPHVGFYGGVNYGFGYTGAGYEGGYWQGNRLFYNREVVNVGTVHVTNVYNKTVIVNNTTRVSFNGPNGVRATATANELAAEHERHVPPPRVQIEHVNAAKNNRELLAKVNHGAPAVAATPKPGVFAGQGVVRAKSAPASAPAEKSAVAQKPAPAGRTDRPATAAHAADANHTSAAHSDRPATAAHAADANHTSAAHSDRPAAASHPASENRTSEARSDRPPAATAHPAAEKAARPAAPPTPPHPAAAAAPPHPAAPPSPPHPAAPSHPPVTEHPAAPPKGSPPPNRDEKRDSPR